MERKKQLRKLFLGFVAICLVVGLSYGISRALKATDPAAAGNAAQVPIMIPGNFTELAENVKTGVVNIQTVKTIRGGGRVFRHFFGNPFGGQNPFEDFFGPGPGPDSPEGFDQKSLGSGFVIDTEGYIVTNNHVIDGADEIKVKLANGKEFSAKVTGRDPKTDLALIKIDGAPGLQPLRMGDSDALKVGSWVVAIGSPFGLEQTVTAGIVSAKGRIIGSGPYDNFIQTDASINPGNSGGPLINMKGEVVGINTAIVASGQGIGFAIPANMAKHVLPQLKQKGKVTRGWLGVGIQEVPPELAKTLGLQDRKGALVSEVFQGGPADKAGIERGDVIVEFDGKEIPESKDLPGLVAATQIGKKVIVKVARSGKLVSKEIAIGEMEEKTPQVAGKSAGKRVGLAIQDLTPDMARSLGLKDTTGVVVTEVEPGSSAAGSGIKRGDVIREVNRQPVQNSRDFMEKVEKAKDGGNVLFLLQRGGRSLYAAVTPK